MSEMITEQSHLTERPPESMLGITDETLPVFSDMSDSDEDSQKTPTKAFKAEVGEDKDSQDAPQRRSSRHRAPKTDCSTPS